MTETMRDTRTGDASTAGQSIDGDGISIPGVSLDDVIAARERIAPYIHRTQLLTSSTLSRMTNTLLWLKAETFQRTGSFKVRGAINAVLQLTPEQRARGVVTMSAGNHGQGLAYAASLFGVRCVVFMPHDAVPTKVEAIKSYGAEARFSTSMETVFPTMEEFRQQHGLHFVHPFGDPKIIAGQGTIGLEILDALPDLESVVVPVGGGGLLAGVALAIKERRPDVRIVGVEPEGAAAVSLSLAAGRPLVMERVDTIADGLAAPFAAEITQNLIQRYVDDVITLSDDEIVNALLTILSRMKVLVEPAGAAGVAALLSGKAGVEHGSKTVAILSGGNIGPERLKQLL